MNLGRGCGAMAIRRCKCNGGEPLLDKPAQTKNRRVQTDLAECHPSVFSMKNNEHVLMAVWLFLNRIKEEAVMVLSSEQWIDVKLECDDLFRQASGGRYKICPAWIVGGL